MNLSYQFLPRFIQRSQVLPPLVRKGIVLAGRSLRGLFPPVSEQARILLPRQDRIQRPFDHDHLRLLEFGDDLRSIRIPLREDRQDAVIQNTLAHLRLYVILNHIIVVYTLNFLFHVSAPGPVRISEIRNPFPGQFPGCPGFGLPGIPFEPFGTFGYDDPQQDINPNRQTADQYQEQRRQPHLSRRESQIIGYSGAHTGNDYIVRRTVQSRMISFCFHRFPFLEAV